MLQCVRAFAVLYWALAGGSDSKEHADKAGDPGLIPGLELAGIQHTIRVLDEREFQEYCKGPGM